MKTPEEIKKLLSDHRSYTFSLNELLSDTLAYIRQLERERDVLLADLTTACADVPNPCPVCGHWRTDWAKPGCELNGLTCKWCWRGVQEVKVDV